MKAKETSALFQDIPFLRRFSRKAVFFPLLTLLLCGAAAGAAAGGTFAFFHSGQVLPLFFSGIPDPQAGFFPCFSTLLLNMLIGLILLFLLGMTAFGVAAVPAFIFLKGVTVGLGVLSFFTVDGLSGLGRAACTYTPVTALASLLLLLFATRTMVFSKRLAKAGFSPQEESLNFRRYLMDFFLFLSFAVMAALVGGLLAVLYGSIFPS